MSVSNVGPVFCFGEILWDVLPHDATPGGAPFNVAYHLHRLGIPVLPVSAVGRDSRGEELLSRLTAWGISTAGMTTHRDAPTGEVTVEVSLSGDAHYKIATAVAWDRIVVADALLSPAHNASGLVFGSLALRSVENRDALGRLQAALPASAWRVFDVNLRAPHDDLALVRRYLELANVLKLNSSEAARLACEFGAEDVAPGNEEKHARLLAEQTNIPLICVTAGARGAGVLRNGHWTWVAANPTTVVDTIGAGDAFLAAFLAGLLRGGKTDRELLAAACRRGEWVASHRGATPSGSPADEGSN